jgi:hypothetical protein
LKAIRDASDQAGIDIAVVNVGIAGQHIGLHSAWWYHTDVEKDSPIVMLSA